MLAIDKQAEGTQADISLLKLVVNVNMLAILVTDVTSQLLIEPKVVPKAVALWNMEAILVTLLTSHEDTPLGSIS